MPFRAPMMYGFILGFQRLVWWPKWTPASSSCFIVTSLIPILSCALLHVDIQGRLRPFQGTRRTRGTQTCLYSKNLRGGATSHARCRSRPRYSPTSAASRVFGAECTRSGWWCFPARGAASPDLQRPARGERAAQLVGHVLPAVSVRQWVPSLPHRQRHLFGWDHGPLLRRRRLAPTAADKELEQISSPTP